MARTLCKRGTVAKVVSWTWARDVLTMVRMPLLALILCCLAALPAQAQEAPDAPPMVNGAFLGMAEAMDAVGRGQWLAAREAAARSGPVAADVVEWLALRAGRGDFERAAGFLARRPDWPGLPLLRRRSEAQLPLVPRGPEEAARVAGFFDGGEPVTGHGTRALIAAWRELGRDGDARATAALAWVGHSLTAETERAILDLYPGVAAQLEAARAERLFWSGSAAALARSAERAEGAQAALLEARVAALRGGDAERLVAGLPEALRDDPGLAHRRFRQLLSDGRHAEAAALLRRRSVSRSALGAPEAWADDRRELARRLMREGASDAAYATASVHWLTGGADLADLEWVSGFLALRMGRAEDAVRHFGRLRAAVDTPISLGRAGYWLGRAHRAAGHGAQAQAAFEAGAAHQTSFYGLLAAEAAGVPLDPALAGDETFPPLEAAAFRDSSVLEAGLLLQAAGSRALAERFLTHLTESLDRDEAGTLADLALSLGEPHIALRIAKRAAEAGIVLPRAYFPVVELGVDPMPVAPELALAIARRESEFDPVVSSHVGAGGLMQLMPGTAQDMTRALGIAYSRDRVYDDPTYNARLGTAYLAGLERRFGANPVLVSAGYNAGPGRPLGWMRERGDPRSETVDVVDWIEMIPFDETRNYVMRVAESLPVYRARLGRDGGGGGAVTLTDELKGR